ncbi:hypothetical protein PBCV1_A462R [Paramecium bursaria Chlorella virus 1]|uniref:Uncharacterized protein n=1 Tax=Paramecium bursaria Chlorella virus 1 TaxID=10506 RepID=Q98512_PBCV1|nr:hypothetical protein PBCV1_A462R [Paramecium bursaria Chlorella virus 1]AAC96829.2 hypothetical protein [Paramecium bursaria Chlorella virus 1]
MYKYLYSFHNGHSSNTPQPLRKGSVTDQNTPKQSCFSYRGKQATQTDYQRTEESFAAFEIFPRPYRHSVII